MSHDSHACRLEGSTSFNCSDLSHCTDVTFPGSVRIGTLYVTGTGFVEHPVDLFIGDPLIGLNSGVDPGVPNTHDLGWLGDRGSDINVASIWDESSDHFALISTTDDSSLKGNLTISAYQDLKVENLLANDKVMVGKGTPLTPLHVSGQGVGNQIVLQASDGGSYLAHLGEDGGGAGYLQINKADGSTYFTASGEKVGIGTDTPSFRLQARSDELTNYVPSSATSTYPSGILFFGDNQNITAGAALMGLYDRATVSTWYVGNAGSQNDGAGAPAYSGPFVVGNRTPAGYSEKFRIDSSGKVGIGTSDPLNGEPTYFGLDISGSSASAYQTRIHLRGSGGATASSTDSALAFYHGNENAGATVNFKGVDGSCRGDLYFSTDNGVSHTEKMVITSGGNIGIGTSSPDAKLEIRGSTSNPPVLLISQDVATDGINIEADTTSSYRHTITHSDSGLIFNSNHGGGPSARPYAFMDGNVGIGTTNPTTALTVAGTISGTIITGSTIAATTVEATSLHQYPVQDVTPTNNYVLTWDDGDSRWEPKDIGTIGAATASNLDNGYTINQNLRTTDDVTFDSGIFNGGLAVGLTVPSGTVGSIVATNDIISFSSSDERLKDNITPIPDSLNKISQIAGVEFDWNKKAYSHLEGHDVGVIAQEIEAVLPEAVTTRDDGYKAVKYEKIIPLLIEGFKEQEKRISALEEKLKD